MPQLLYSPLASTGQQRGFYGPRPPDIRKLPPPPLPPPSLPPPPSHLAGRRLVRVSSSDRLVSGRSATATTWPSHHEAASHDSSRTGGNEIDKQSPYDQSHQIPTFKPNYDIPLLDPSTVPPLRSNHRATLDPCRSRSKLAKHCRGHIAPHSHHFIQLKHQRMIIGVTAGLTFAKQFRQHT